MDRVYISGKVGNGKSVFSEEELEIVRSKFEKVEIQLQLLGYKTINPMRLSPIGKANWLGWMRASIRALMVADYIYLLPDYRQSKGARIERIVCKLIGIPIFKGKVD